MLKRFWQNHKKFILISLLIYLVLTLIVIFGSLNSKDLPFIYQIR
jgi:hypothetical protein